VVRTLLSWVGGTGNFSKSDVHRQFSSHIKMIWEVLSMEKDTSLTEKENYKEENIYTVTIDNNTYHIISKFIGTNTSSKILYDLAVKRILYDDSI